MEQYFPDLSRSASEIDQAAHLLKRTQLKLREIIAGQDVAADVARIDEYLLNMFRPGKFDGSDGLVISMQTSFEETCLLLGQHINRDVKKMTVREFYTALRVVKKNLRRK